ncbi:hypothetical protein J7J00_21920 [Bacillus sp. ISL-4]|uniref:hypothetical protein n=1 Tax=Bacillus sp. ISL-4 TaxID=2819125 RepID=UPI001BE94B9A|nr:hypothetical protein [Bacillus sp. ISL-4]MBT2668104.1 hypothetical protein [Bacillus sp. ISL-4]MBT2673660.1 hypothetical protein [Streptomyces sp. ISL-14]
MQKHDIHPNERVFFSKEVEEEVGMQHPLSKGWSKLRMKRIWVIKMVSAYLYSIRHRSGHSVRDTDKPLEDTAKDLVYLQ